MSAAPLIVLTAGGTGGHVFPAEALANELLDRGYRLAFVTDARGKEYPGTLGTLETHGVSAGQMLGRGPIHKLRSLLSLTRGAMQARSLFRRFAPAAVVGFGGYASVPAVAAATTLGIPTLIHEQNAVLGRANRMFAGRVTRIATSFEKTAAVPSGTQAVRTGNPVRPAIATTPYAVPHGDEPINILVLGGSQGARVFTDILPEAFQALPEAYRARLRVAQQVRPEDVERANEAYMGSGLHIDLRTFFQDVPERLRACHLLIARAGASTVAETSVAGRPALLVPYPHAADDHQTANARAFVEAGAGWMLPQSEATPERMAEMLADVLLMPQRLADAAAKAHAFAIPDAAKRLADAVVDLLPVNQRLSTAALERTL